jgi:NTE family protein
MRWEFGPFSVVSKPRLGVALGSGAARGWAHLGLLRGLEEEGIQIDVVTGTSAGAVVGVFYAAEALENLESFAHELKSFRTTFNYMDFTFASRGLIGGKRFNEFLEGYLPVRRFDRLRRPFGVVASDLTHLNEVHIYEGALIPAIRASVAVPGFLEPVQFGDMQLVDGGLLNPVPVSLARKLGADIVIGVDLNAHVEVRSADSMTGIFNRTIEVMMNRIRLNNREFFPADYWIEPQLSDYTFFDFHRTQDAIEQGRALAAEHAPAIRKLKTPHVFARDRAMRMPEMMGRALTYAALRDDEE